MTRLAVTRRFRGYTLIEVIIALGIGVGILAALAMMFSSNSGNQQELERSLRQMENARFAMDTLSEDAVHAGFFGDFNPNLVAPAPTYTSPDPCAVATNLQGWTVAAGVVTQLPRPIEGIAAGTAVACLPNRRANTEALVVRRAETTGAILVASARTDNLYLQTARCSTEAGQVRAAASPGANPQGTFNLQDVGCTGGFNNAVRRLLQRTYYIATCNDCVNNDNIPTLKRVEMIDGARRTTSIAEGVENLQLEFGVDGNNDSIPDNVLTTGAMTAADWPNVVSVRMHVLTRATQPTPGFVETRTFQLGPNVSLAPASFNNDGFKRTLLSTTMRLNNVGSRRE